VKFDDYQAGAARTAMYEGRKSITLEGVNYTLRGLAGEVGELAGAVMKEEKNRFENRFSAMLDVVDELGDKWWYTSALCDELGVTLMDQAKEAISRFTDADPSRAETPNGFQSAIYAGAHIYPHRLRPNGLMVATLELTRCAGFLSNLHKKFLRRDWDYEILRTRLENNLPELLVAGAAVADEMNVPLERVLQLNLQKLGFREETGTIQDNGGRDVN